AGILERPEMPRERHLLLVRELLIAENKHGIAIHARFDGGNLGGYQRLAGITSGHLADEQGMKLADLDRHGLPPVAFQRGSRGLRGRGGPRRARLRADASRPKPGSKLACRARRCRPASPDDPETCRARPPRPKPPRPEPPRPEQPWSLA